MRLAKTLIISECLGSRHNTTANRNCSMELDEKKVFKTLNINRIWLPVVLGVSVAFYLFASDDNFSLANLSLIRKADWRYILLVLLAVMVRDLGYMYRIRALTHNGLSWLSSFYVIVLWEFSSAVTPSVVGGSLVAIFLLLKEGINLGKSLAYVIITSIFDNLFFIGATSLGFVGAYDSIFVDIAALDSGLGSSLRVLFWSSHALVTAYTLIMLLAIFVRPKFFKWALLKITSIGVLKRWQQAARKHGDEIILASQALQGETFFYWLKIGGITLVTWSARYLVINLIIASYIPLDFIGHLVILGKQVIVWTVMLVSPTPGSSGTAEFFYQQLHKSVLGDYTLITGVLWRVLTYYFYLIIGVFYLPRWLKRVFPARR
jgi:glycosyltransferase 2 family protein